ncbi:MAG: Flp pilus assembly protein CpaB [Aliidiomarina sp.]|uniref:Flp pilus assembly protein CpaB n=1 Tax=Aliidiomarina sp. TaxID=1872439 RepID=UPI0025BF6D2C|nr:Flp pilus assembly protein CpaB [Aliidiomarina sp.]MCH8502079.1 Flp pilus assembly protein CpaB [Aliidiomarina sp.]
MKFVNVNWKNYGWLLLPLAIGAFAALIAWYIVTDHVQQMEDDLAEKYRQSYHTEQNTNVVIDVLVAAKNLPAGTQLSAENMQVRTLNRDALPSDSIPASRAATYLGRYVRSDLMSPIARGKAIQEMHLTLFNENRLSHHLDSEETAFSFRVDDAQHHGGNLYVGDQLDIYARHPTGSQLLMAGRTILAIDGQFASSSGERGGKQNQALLTIAVPNQDLPKLHYWLDAGQLHILLRHPHLAHDSPERIGKPLVEWIIPHQSDNQFSLQLPYAADQGW